MSHTEGFLLFFSKPTFLESNMCILPVLIPTLFPQYQLCLSEYMAVPSRYLRCDKQRKGGTLQACFQSHVMWRLQISDETSVHFQAQNRMELP